MAKQNKPKVNVKKIDNAVLKLNGLFNDVIDNIVQNNYKADTRNEKEVKRINKAIRDVVKDELSDLKNYTGDNISTFLVKTFNDNEQNDFGNNGFKLSSNINSLEDLFEGSEGSIFTAFSDRYKNKALLYEDLETIASQLIELGEAVNTTTDAIVTADDVGSTISRSLKFRNNTDTENEDESILTIVKEIEKKMKLTHKIKNHIVPKTLTYGKYYAYIIPQSKLFEDAQKDKLKEVKTMESLLVDDETIKFVAENVTIINDEDNKPNFGFNSGNNKTDNTVKEALLEMAKCINISNDDLALPLLENVGMMDAMMDLSKYNKSITKKGKKKESNVYFGMDGVTSTNEKKSKIEDFTFIEDCYIKLLDPKKVIPVKIMEYTIGYYYLHEQAPEIQKNPFNSSINMVKNDHVTEKDVVGKIAEKIVKAFDKSYLENNIQFKDFILNALLYNNAYKKKIHFQFIPAEYICEFKVNEDENGEGTSMLMKSLFYAKLYLALLIFNIITHLSKSTDTKIYYVKNSGIDKDVVGKTMEVARDIKAKQINFADLLNYGTIMSKVGTGKEIFMPVGQSGEKGIEFDILSGQQVDMQNDFLEMLNRAYINGTGVPSVIMNYINEADYAKTLVMANAKFLGRVLSYQMDFNESISEMYRKVLKFTTDIPDEVLDDLEFTFTPPKMLNNMNISDITSYTENIIEFLTNVAIGQEGEQQEDIGTVKDLLKKKLAKEIAPMLPWDKIEDMLEDALLEAKKIQIEKNATSDPEHGSSDDTSSDDEDEF
ncbi:hypothetical protein [Romboutsia ilealis]|uniref:hypothetical protein n=1 Tax=Romboutsia ilealis TaxID=1115758 RepID=UPI00272A53F3|nr:hypothetical protein [Romboutsia ilealis]